MTHALVIDDDPQICLVIRAWLELEGIDAILAPSAARGFEAFHMFNFDVMLVDIFMPKIDGLTAITTLRKWAPEIPIIVMSGFVPRHGPQALEPAPDYFGKALALGASCCLYKPFQAEQLLASVETCVGELASAPGRRH